MQSVLNKSHSVKVRWKDAYKPILTIELYSRALSQMASIGQTGLHLMHCIDRPSSFKIHPKGDALMTYTIYCTKVSVPWLTRLSDKLDNFSWALKSTPANISNHCTVEEWQNRARFNFKNAPVWRHNVTCRKIFWIPDSTGEEDASQDSKVLLWQHIEV